MSGNLTTVGPDCHCVSGGHCVVLTSELVKMKGTTSLVAVTTFLLFLVHLWSLIPMFLSNTDNAMFFSLFHLITLDFWQYVIFQQTLEDL